jgi:hypothetical protein
MALLVSLPVSSVKLVLLPCQPSASTCTVHSMRCRHCSAVLRRMHVLAPKCAVEPAAGTGGGSHAISAWSSTSSQVGSAKSAMLLLLLLLHLFHFGSIFNAMTIVEHYWRVSPTRADKFSIATTSTSLTSESPSRAVESDVHYQCRLF